MSNYPTSLDDDTSIVRIDDNLSELGTEAINQLREAVFAIEETLGVNPQGTKTSLESRISTSINYDGTIKSTALSSVGLVTLPITNSQIASNAGISESKLALDYSTVNLRTTLDYLEDQVITLSNAVATTRTDFLTHISGGTYLSNGVTLARHVASHIDLNAVPTDPRDTYTWTGLLDHNGVQRSATTVASGLLQINNDLVAHENTTTLAHPATAITVDTADFTSLPQDAINVQEVLDFIDDKETTDTGIDRATLHKNGIPRAARSQDMILDGYGLNLIPVTPISAFLAEPNQQRPNDSINNGDDVISFFPTDNSDFSFDTKFAQVKVGDIVHVNYGLGFEYSFPITSIRFIPGSEWVVRINTYNLFNTNRTDGYDGYARIDRARFDTHTWGCYAAAGVVPDTFPGMTSSDILGSIIVGSPKGACAVGLGFDPSQIDSTHYNLHLALYPDGVPFNGIIYLPAIDVSGNQGATPGKYTIDRVVETANKQFRASGYNFRFIAFNHKGEFGIMLADSYNNASFSIISGIVSGASIATGVYIYNVVGDGAGDNYDALGLGAYRSGFATPIVPPGGSYLNAIVAASFPTLVISPVRDRNVLINGSKKNILAKPSTYFGDGYWNATVTAVTTDLANNTKTVEYTIPLDLGDDELAIGKTIVVLPSNPTAPSSYLPTGYGRFIIGDIAFINICNPDGGSSAETKITVINGVYGSGDPLGTTSSIGRTVRVYFSDDSVGINETQIIGGSGGYHRYIEIFANDIAETFAIERARMIKQSLSGSLLDTQGSNWRIRQVSKNFKGNRVASVLGEFRYFTRLIITNYNTVTGEIDGYLGDPTSLLNNGPVTRGKKDNHIRFYDSTYINFIDVEFREDALYPGSIIIPDTNDRYVDIEIFPSLADHDEHFLIAGASYDENQFQSITDLRQFGTLSEENFTDSAVQFVQAGERYLHANGVVRGFKYVTHADRLLTFSGGLALVNGGFVCVDSLSVHTPNIINASIGSTIDFFICVTETGQLKSIPKDIGSQFFDSLTNSFIESLTFREIIDNRKDLTIIGVATFIISSDGNGGLILVFSNFGDARRFVYNQDITKFSWAYTNDEDGYNASFKTPESLMNWVNEYGVDHVEVIYANINSSVQLNFNNPVVLSGGMYEISTPVGILFTSGNWKIKDAQVFYYPNFTPTSVTNYFNTDSDYGAFVISSSISGTTIDGCEIENVKFFGETIQRPPFIGAYGDNVIFTNFTFTNNIFTDVYATNGLAFAFVKSTPGSSLIPVFRNITICENKISANQGLLISGRAVPESGTGYVTTSCSNVDNFRILNNKFGFIGTMVSNGRIVIDNNETQVISSGITATQHTDTGCYGLGLYFPDTYSAEYIITKNSATMIKTESTAGTLQFKTIVSSNTVKRTASVLLPVLFSQTNYSGIIISSDSYDGPNIVCCGNTIDGWETGYTNGIYCEGGATINNNVVSNIAALGYGIYHVAYLPDQASAITGNSISRGDNIAISAFISTQSTTNVSGNTFSHFTLSNATATDGYDGYDGYSDGYNGQYYLTNLNILSGASDTFTHNINQVGVQFLGLNNSQIITNPTPSTNAGNISTYENEVVNIYAAAPTYGLVRIASEPNALIWHWSTNSGTCDGRAGVIMPVDNLIPHGSNLLYFYINAYVTGNWSYVNNYSGGNARNVYPKLVLEVNGEEVDSVNISGGAANYDLKYFAPPLYSGERNVTKQYSNIVVRTKFGINIPNDYEFGGWFGPVGSGTLTLGRPYVKYLY